MKHEETPDAGFSRRRFLRGAALAGAAAVTAPRLLAKPESAGKRVESLATPGAPSAQELGPLAPLDRQPPSLNVPKPQRKLGWSIVGLGELALEQILPAFGSCRMSRPAALVSGHAGKAKQLAEVYGVDPRAVYDYKTFDQLKDNSEVDVIYVVLPNSMHAEFTIRGLGAGKHVLCEKPMASSVAECEAMIAAAGKAGRKLGVAYRLHYEPMNLTVMDMCRQKKFGTIKTFTASNCQQVKAPNIRLSGPLGGGPTGDLGIYCINAARYTVGEEPLEVMAIQCQPKSDPRFREVPESVSFLMRYSSGVIAECQCSFGTARSSTYSVLCDKGSIHMDPAYTYSGLRLWTESAENGIQSRTELSIEPVDQFAAEMDSFSQSVLNNEPVRTPGELGLSDIRIILAILESARLGGQPVKIS